MNVLLSVCPRALHQPQWNRGTHDQEDISQSVFKSVAVPGACLLASRGPTERTPGATISPEAARAAACSIAGPIAHRCPQPTCLDAASLRRAAAVMRDRRDIRDGHHLQARYLELADRRLAPGARPLHVDLDLAHTMLDRLAGRALRRHLRRVGRALARALDAYGPPAGPRHHVPVRVCDRHDSVIER